MSSWKRDAASGLVVLLPLLVTLYVIAWLYGQVASITPFKLLQSGVFIALGFSETAAAAIAEFFQVLVSLLVFALLVLATGYLMRTAIGTLLEGLVDDLINQIPGLRVIYNASKMAIETALTGAEGLQKPVKVTVWGNMRMTAFKTGKQSADGREILFLPTAPNITTGFVIEAREDEYEDTDESVEDALTRVLSAGFGETDKEIPPGLVDEHDLMDSGSGTESE